MSLMKKVLPQFGEAVSRVLKEHGLSDRAAQFRTGIDRITLASMRSGYQVSLEKVEQFALAFGLDVNEWRALGGYQPLPGAARPPWRTFRWGRASLDDPDPSKTPDEVLRQYASIGLPGLQDAAVEFVGVEDGRPVFQIVGGAESPSLATDTPGLQQMLTRAAEEGARRALEAFKDDQRAWGAVADAVEASRREHLSRMDVDQEYGHFHREAASMMERLNDAGVAWQAVQQQPQPQFMPGWNLAAALEALSAYERWALSGCTGSAPDPFAGLPRVAAVSPIGDKAE